MEIIEYQPHHLAELTELYNKLTQTIPHCYPIYPAELAAAFAGECGYESFGARLQSEAVFVAVDRTTVGFVHVGKGSVDEEGSPMPQGSIRFLAYPRGRRDIGQALLNHAEAWLRAHGLNFVLVYQQEYRYPFYHLSHAYLSNRLEHIQSLLLFNGYELCGGEIFLDWPNMDPDPPRELSGLKVDLEITHEPSQGRLPDLKIKAHYKGQEIGECVSLSARAFSNREMVEDWLFTWWLGISEPFQGNGLGRYLLGSALIEARQVGYRHAAISTALDNHRALLFYANFGYRAVDWTRQFSRTLQ